MGIAIPVLATTGPTGRFVAARVGPGQPGRRGDHQPRHLAARLLVVLGIAGNDPSTTFRPLIVYYVIPVLFIGVLMAVGALPVLV